MQKALLRKEEKSDPWYKGPIPGVGCVFKNENRDFFS